VFNQLLGNFSHDIGIDLGTANTLVYVRGQGIVINEPSVVAINTKTNQILAIGDEAKRMVGKTPASIVATRPLVDGVVSDFEVTEQMLRYFIDKVHKQRFRLLARPRVVIGIPSGVTEVEKRAVEDAASNAGARQTLLIEEPMAAAIGSRLPVQDAAGSMIVDIGGGTTEVAVISLGGIVAARSIRIAGDELSDDIVKFARDEFNLSIGERTAEEIKIAIGSAFPVAGAKSVPMRGRHLVTGLPKEVEVTSEEIRKALIRSVREIVEAIKITIEETPPELVADIMSRGIILAGGGALLGGLGAMVHRETNMPVHIADDPLTSVVRGTGLVLEDLDSLKEMLVPSQFRATARS
jgi:rod shape-determining protein MreB